MAPPVLAQTLSRFLLFPPGRRRALVLAAAAAVAVPVTGAAPATAHHRDTGYVETALVSDVAGRGAATVDPHLVNPWGVSFGPATPLWTANEGDGTSTLFSGANATTAIVTPVPLVVTIPGTAMSPKGQPTGTVFNSTTAFPLPDGTQSRFLFDDMLGQISAWAPGSTRAQVVARVPRASFTGLTLAVTKQGPRLYAADEASGVVRIFDGSFRQVGQLPRTGLPRGLAPYNVQVLGDRLYVTYEAPDGVTSSVSGAIDLFKLDGRFLRHLVVGGPLDSPWGLAIAPRHWGQFSRDLLVGNEDGGWINAFNPRTGKLKGTLTDRSGMPIRHVGLWGLAFGNGVIGTPSTLIFVAGVDEYQHGFVGAITPAPRHDG